MCLVEIEGIPKLQTSCSTPIREGMVVNTTSDRVKKAQEAVVEFLLINHPLDCPVCDKGGECPLQDISYGWGGGKSRYIEPKRHFKKPLELSPLVAIDRERCILCYRCVRFSQEVAEDYQLVFLERGDHTYVGTHDGRPYVGPFSGNIIELCPVGALTSTAYRFRARPWDIEGAGSVCTLCPGQCNVEYTVRDDSKVLRVLDRQNDEVDDGWLCDKGRFGYEAVHAPERLRAPMVRDGGYLREVSWERALDEAAKALTKAGDKAAALAGGRNTTNEEGFALQHLFRAGLGSPHLDSRATGPVDPGQARVLARPDLSARVSDIDHADVVLVVESELVDEMAALDLRVRKAVRRNHAKLVTLTSRPGTLDANGTGVRYAPGATDAALTALAAELGSDRADGSRLGSRAGAEPGTIAAAAEMLKDAGDVVILWGERVAHGDRGRAAVDALLAVAAAARHRRQARVRPDRGARVGQRARPARGRACCPTWAPAWPTRPPPGRVRRADRRRPDRRRPVHAGAAARRPAGRPTPQRGRWEDALEAAATVIAFADFATDALTEHATVIFPAEAGPGEGGHADPPRRPAPARAPGHRPPGPDAARVERAGRAGRPLRRVAGRAVGARADGEADRRRAVLRGHRPGGHRRHRRALAGRRGRGEAARGGAAHRRAGLAARAARGPAPGPDPLDLGRPGDRARAVAALPGARSSAPSWRPSDAKRIGVQSGDRVEVSAGDASVQATVALRQAIQPGSVFLLAGTLEDNAHRAGQRLAARGRGPRIESEQRSPLAVVAAGGPDAEPPPS